MVQVGNEINGGMLWSTGSTDTWSQLAGLLNSGYDAVKAVDSATPVALHLAKGGDPSSATTTGRCPRWRGSATADPMTP